MSLSPQKSLALVGGKGQTTNRSVLIVNREADPLRIVTVEHPTDRFTTRLETIEDGRRYRVTLTLRPDGPLGRGQQTLRIKTSSSATPVLAIPIGVRLTPKVYTSVEELDLGSRALAELRSSKEAPVEEFAVFQAGGRDFRITHTTDLPMLTLTSERDRRGGYYVVRVSLDREKVQPGTFKGSIFIETNDPDVPKLTLPVRGSIPSSEHDEPPTRN